MHYFKMVDEMKIKDILSHLEQGCEEGKDLCSAVDNHVLVLMASGIFST